MLRSYYGLEKHPFSQENIRLLDHQQQILDTLNVHSQQGGLCVVVGEPGTGKSIIKEAIINQSVRNKFITPVINRTLHTYHNTLRIICDAFQIDTEGSNHICEKRLIEEALRINHIGKMLVPIIDDAHLMDIDSLRRLRLLCEDFPKNHNLILIAQPNLLTKLSLSVNEDIKSRVTYSAFIQKLTPDDIEKFILEQLDKVTLPHNTFSENALNLIARSSEGILRKTRNLCLSSMIEAVRDKTRQVDLKQVNRVLLQPHWRQEMDLEF